MIWKRKAKGIVTSQRWREKMELQEGEMTMIGQRAEKSWGSLYIHRLVFGIAEQSAQKQGGVGLWYLESEANTGTTRP